MSVKGVRLFQAVMRPVQRLPLGFHYAWGRVFAFVAHHLLHYRQREVMTNLARSFPEKKYAELNAIADRFYLHLGDILAEALWFGGCRRNPEKLSAQQLCTTPDASELLQSFRERPSVMLLSSHLGNWELTGGFFQFVGEDVAASAGIREDNVCVVYRRLHSAFWDQFMKDNRCAMMGPDFEGCVESGNVLRYALERREKKMLYIFPTDQFPYGKSARHEVPSFLHQKTLAMTGAAALACKLGMAVFYVGFPRGEWRQYVPAFHKICDDASQMAPGAVMEAYYALLEKDIQRDPSGYLWSHKRWK